MTKLAVILAALAIIASLALWWLLRNMSDPEWMNAFEPPEDEAVAA